MSSRIVLVYCIAILFIHAKSERDKSILISSYAKVSKVGSSSSDSDNNEARSNLAGQQLWTQRSDAHVSKKQTPTKIYAQPYPVYAVTPKRISDKRGNGDDKIPGKGEVVIQERFIQSRPFVNYGDSKNKPDLTYIPPTYSKKPDITFIPPDYPLSKPSEDSPPPVPYPPLVMPATEFNKTDNNSPLTSYDSPYSSYNPPNSPPSYFYKKPNMAGRPNNVYPPYLDYNPNKDSSMTQEESKKPEIKPTEDNTPPYLEFDPYKKEHNHQKDEGKPTVTVMPYVEYNPNENKHMDNQDQHPDKKLPEYLDYNPYEHHNGPEKPEMAPSHSHDHSEAGNDDKHPDFPAYLYNQNGGSKNNNNNFPGVPPYLEYNPYELKGGDKGPPITQTVPPPSDDFSDHHHFPKTPDYLDHEPAHGHDFHDFFHHFNFPPIYHEVKPPTTTPEPEKERVNKKPYTYYYIGRKLWYIPLYFSVYFIVYVFVLVLKSIARHKITFNQYFEQDRSMKSGDENLEQLTEHVITGIDYATEKYGD